MGEGETLRLTVTPILSVFVDPIYLVKGNGQQLQHAIALPYPTVSTPTQRTLSMYIKNVDIRFAQFAMGQDPNIHANFDLQLGMLETKHANA